MSGDKPSAILVAEPVATDAERLTRMLRRLGHAVRSAGTSDEALDVLRHEILSRAVVAAELVVEDELLLACVSRLPAMRWLVAVGPAQDGEIEIRARHAGAQVYLPRPVMPEALAPALHVPLAGSVLTRAP